jgi:hypothetical protein
VKDWWGEREWKPQAKSNREGEEKNLIEREERRESKMHLMDKEAEIRKGLAKRVVGNEEAVKVLVVALEEIAGYPQETTDFEARYLATLANNALLQLTRDELEKEVKAEIGV